MVVREISSTAIKTFNETANAGWSLSPDPHASLTSGGGFHNLFAYQEAVALLPCDFIARGQRQSRSATFSARHWQKRDRKCASFAFAASFLPATTEVYLDRCRSVQRLTETYTKRRWALGFADRFSWHIPRISGWILSRMNSPNSKLTLSVWKFNGWNIQLCLKRFIFENP